MGVPQIAPADEAGQNARPHGHIVVTVLQTSSAGAVGLGKVSTWGSYARGGIRAPTAVKEEAGEARVPDRSPPAILIADSAAAARNDATNRRARENVVDAANHAIEATGAQG